MEENREDPTPDEGTKALSSQRVFSEGPSKVSASSSKPEKDTLIAKATAKKLKIPFVDPLRVRIEPSAVALLEPDMAIRRQALPIRLINGTLLVAMASPGDPVAMKSLQLLTGFKIRPAVAPRSSVSAVLQKVYGKEGNTVAKSPQKAPRSTPTKAPQMEKEDAFAISIISNKGGVGKTHLSINLAYALAGTGAKVLLIDADLGNADISNKLGIFPEYHLLDFLEKDHEMQELIFQTKFHFDLIGGTFGEFKLANLHHVQKIKFIKHFKNISQDYDFVIFDLGAGISRTVLDFALAANSIVIVTTPQDVISGYACVKASFFRFREIEKRLEEKDAMYTPQWTFAPMLVINQVKDLRQGVELYDTIEKTAESNVNTNEDRFRIRPEYLGAIPYDKESMRSTEAKKKPLLLDFPSVKAAQCIRHISLRFSNAESAYDPDVKFRNPLKRFAAILSQKI